MEAVREHLPLLSVGWAIQESGYSRATCASGGGEPARGSTNLIENLNGAVAHFARNVRRWRDGTMIVRWVASAVREAETKFRRLKGYKQMPQLLAALDVHAPSELLDKRKKAAQTTRDRGAVTLEGSTANGTSPVERPFALVPRRKDGCPGNAGEGGVRRKW